MALLDTGHGWPLSGGLHGPQRGCSHARMVAAAWKTAFSPFFKGTVGGLGTQTLCGGGGCHTLLEVLDNEQLTQ